MVAQQAGGQPPAPMLLSGIVPPLAESFHQRPETGLALRSGLYPGDTVVLTQAGPTASGPAGQGGTGKTQLAVSYAYGLWSIRAVEVLVWVNAANREAVITGYAQAARAVGAGGAGAEAAADRFAAWMASTRRPWALVLDDLTNPADLENLWPAGPAGQVVITTRLSGDGLDSLTYAATVNAAPANNPGGAGGLGLLGAGPPNLRIATVGGFSPRETLSYLSARLTGYPEQRVEALDLGEDLDGLPLGLAQAAAVMELSGLSCREYRAQFAERREHMSGVPVAGVSAAVLATWSLAVECAHRLAPEGLAWPALALAALLDSHGIPAAVLTSPAACSYITGRPSAADGADQELIRAAISNLARAGLVSLDPASPVRTVRIHRCVQAAVRGYLQAADREAATLAAADALTQAWSDVDGEASPGPAPAGPALAGPAPLEQAPPEQAPPEQASPEQAPLEQAPLEQALLEQALLEQALLEQALRDCVAALRGVDGGPLWQGQAHPLLFRAGLSLHDSGLPGSAITYWQAMLTTSSRRFGSRHADTVVARNRLAAAYESGGRFGDAIAVFASTLADAERRLGREHPDTITARGQLARAYASAGRPAEAATLYEQVITAAGRQLGLAHPATLTARAQLAQAYLAAGRSAESAATYRRLLTDAERILGLQHPLTRSIRENLDHGTPSV